MNSRTDNANRQGRQLIQPALLTALLTCALTACSGATPTTSSTQTTSDAILSKEQALTEKAASLKKLLNIPNPPDVTPVRWVRPEEVTATNEECMAAAGWPTDRKGSVTPEQDAENRLAAYTCLMRYPVLPQYDRPYGQAQKEAQYNWTIEYVLPCLEANGYTLIRPVPSKAAFIDSMATDPFLPFAELNDRLDEFKLTDATVARLNRDCAQNVPSTIAWDGMTLAEYKSTHPFKTGK